MYKIRKGKNVQTLPNLKTFYSPFFKLCVSLMNVFFPELEVIDSVKKGGKMIIVNVKCP